MKLFLRAKESNQQQSNYRKNKNSMLFDEKNKNKIDIIYQTDAYFYHSWFANWSIFIIGT